MRKAILFSFVLFLGISMSSTVWALAFTETFLGTTDDNEFFAMAENSFLPYPETGSRATFNFRLDANGGRARLFDENGDRIRNELPTTDFLDFDPATMTIESASMSFNFSSEDPQHERIRIRVAIPGTNNLNIFNEAFNVAGVGSGGFDFSFDLAQFDLLDDLNDGRITSIVLAPEFGGSGVASNFLLNQVSLSGTAAPVPEPATMVLLGTGLVGLVGFRKKFKK